MQPPTDILNYPSSWKSRRNRHAPGPAGGLRLQPFQVEYQVARGVCFPGSGFARTAPRTIRAATPTRRSGSPEELDSLMERYFFKKDSRRFFASNLKKNHDEVLSKWMLEGNLRDYVRTLPAPPKRPLS